VKVWDWPLRLSHWTLVIAIAVAFLIQAQQILPVTLLGIAMAPEFIFKRGQRRAADVPGEIPSASRGEAGAGD